MNNTYQDILLHKLRTFHYEPLYAKYVALENLLIAYDELHEENSKKKNKFFSISDFMILKEEHKEIDYSNKVLQHRYLSSIYSENIPSITDSDRSNFHQMMNGKRQINIHMVKALKQFLLDGYIDINENKEYYHVEGILSSKLKSMDYSSFNPILDYIQQCYFITYVTTNSDKAKGILNGKDLNDKLKDISSKIMLPSHDQYRLYYSCDIHLKEYFTIPDFLLEEINYDSDMRNWLDEIKDQLQPPAPIPEIDYSKDSYQINSINELKQYIADLPNSKLLFLINNLDLLLSSDQDFLRILYLTHFLSPQEAKRIECTLSDLAFGIQSNKRILYSKDIKNILAIPSFPTEFLSIGWASESKIENVAIQFVKHNATPITIHTIFNMEEYHLSLAKYLYITDILPLKYGHIRCNGNDKFISDTLISAFQDLANCNINRDLSAILNKST